MSERFSHFIPLILFTAMVAIAAGIITGACAVVLSGSWIRPGTLRLLLLAAVFNVAAGGLSGFAHLGRPLNSTAVFRGLGHSYLSLEALLCLLFTILSASALFVLQAFGHEQGALSLLIAAASAFGLLSTVLTGMVYRLGPQLSWKTPAHVLGPLVSALLLANSIALIFTLNQGITVFISSFFVLWCADFALAAVRLVFFERNRRRNRYVVFRALAKYAVTMGVIRLILMILVSAVFIIDAYQAAPFIIACAILVDRFCLYAGSVRASPAAILGDERERRLSAAAGKAVSEGFGSARTGHSS